MKSKKDVIKLVFLFAIVFLLVASAKTGFCKPPYKIGLVDSNSGFVAFIGSAARMGFMLAVDTINDSGGISGHKIEVVNYDDESDVSKGVMAMKKLIETDKVLFVGGASSSGVAIAVAPIAEKSRVPFFAGNSSRWAVAKPKKWKIPDEPTEVYGYTAKFRNDAQDHLNYMYGFLKKLGAKKLGWANANTALGNSAKEAFVATYKRAGFDVVASEEYGPHDSMMTSQLSKIKASDCDAILLYSAEPAGGLFYKQAREMGITKPIIADSPLMATSILDTLGDHLVGLYILSNASDIPDINVLPQRLKPMGPVVEKVRKGIMEKYKYRADGRVGQGYDRAMLMIDALRRAAPDPTKLEEAREKIRQALLSIKGYVGCFAMGDMSPTHEIPVPESIVLVEKGKNYRFIWTLGLGE